MFSYCADVVGDCGGTFEFTLILGGLFLLALLLRGVWYVLFQDTQPKKDPIEATDASADDEGVGAAFAASPPGGLEAASDSYQLITFAGHELGKLAWLAAQGWLQSQAPSENVGYWLVVDYGIYLTPSGEHPEMLRAYARSCDPSRQSARWEDHQLRFAPRGRAEYFLERGLIDEAARNGQDLIAQHTPDGMVVGFAKSKSLNDKTTEHLESNARLGSA